MGYAHLDLGRTPGRVRLSCYVMWLIMTLIHSSFKLLPCYEQRKALLKLSPKPERFDLPLRSTEAVQGGENEVPSVNLPVEDQWLSEWVNIAVQEVGWATRDVYAYLRKPNSGDINSVFHLF